MYVIKSINFVRRNILKNITKNIGKTRNYKDVGLINKNDIKKILIIRPNHRLGNQLLISPLIQEVSNTFPNCTIDLFVKGNIASILFRHFENIDKIIRLPKNHFKELFKYFQGWLNIRKQHYDIVINAIKTSSSGRLSTKFARSKYKFYGDDEPKLHLEHPDYLHIAKYPVYNFRSFLKRLGVSETDNEIPSLDIKLTASEIEKGGRILKSLTDIKKGKTICLFTYATGTKCYSELWWSEFYGKLKSKYSNYNFIEILPFENISKISFKEPAYYSKDVRQIGAVIANTHVFIGADSGIMHLASSVKTSCIGLFTVTDPDNYAPYGNKSKGLDTNKLSLDEIIEEIDNILIG